MIPLLLHAAPELAGGRFPAPGWLILAGGAVVVVFAVAFLALRARRGDGGKR